MISVQPQAKSTNTIQEGSFPAISKQASPSNTLNLNSKTFNLLVIDHSSAQTNLPSYKLELQSNGIGMFTGRKNTAILGSKKIYVSGEMIQQIKDIMLENKFETGV